MVAGGIVLADQVSGNLALISYNVNQSQSLLIIPANFNLGNLTSGHAGTVTENATLTIPTNGTYAFKLDKDTLKGAFSQFNVTIKLGNQTVILLLHGRDDVHVNLTKGTYTVVIIISYLVSSHAHHRVVENEPLITVKQLGNDSEET
ncbi:hypothetical protein HLB03_04300 [Acidianus sp. DSM 29099]|nr:hypothetical protein [Acidianus sp. RZ1]